MINQQTEFVATLGDGTTLQPGAEFWSIHYRDGITRRVYVRSCFSRGQALVESEPTGDPRAGIQRGQIAKLEAELEGGGT